MSPSRKPTVPSIYAYVDYRKFLADCLDQIRNHDSAFSDRAFARQAGLGAPNAIQRVLSGAVGLRPAKAEAVATALGLDEAERRFFILLTRWQGARKTSSKQKLEADLRRCRAHAEAQSSELAIFEALSNPVSVALRELLRTAQTPRTDRALARMLYPRATSAQVNKALKPLLALGVVHKKGNEYYATSEALIGPSNIVSSATRSFNQKSLDMAKTAMVLPLNERSYGTLTIACTAEQQRAIFQALRHLHETLLATIAADNSEADRVMHVGTYAIPMSRPHPKDAQ